MGRFLELKKNENWEFVSRLGCDGAVVILCYDMEKNLYLTVEQFRPSVNKRIIEFPAGLIETGEDPKDCAVRELMEETGIRINKEKLIDLGYVYSSVGLSDEKVYLFAVILDSTTDYLASKLSIQEKRNNLVIKYMLEEDIYNLFAAKVLTTLCRFKLKMKDNNIIFPID